MQEEVSRRTEKKIVLKCFVDESGKKYSLKVARNMLKTGVKLFCLASCDNEDIVTKTVTRFLSLTTFETKDDIYEVIDTENLPIRCDVVRYVNCKTEQETYHEAIAQKWLQNNEYVTAVVVTDDGSAYRTSCIVKIHWHDHLFLTSSGRRYLFSQ